MTTNTEYEVIVEFSFNEKSEQFVIRFLSGESYCLPVKDLPKRLITKKPAYKAAKLNPTHNSLLFEAAGEVREIPFHMIHSKGTPI